MKFCEKNLQIRKFRIRKKTCDELVIDAENVTLRWPRPEGRVDVYHIKWYPNKNVDDIRQKEISGNVPTEGIGRNIAVLVPDLHPGVEYMFEITTEAHGRRSQTTKTRVRTMPLITSEITVINQPEVTTALTLRYTPTPLTSALFDTYRYLNTGFQGGVHILLKGIGVWVGSESGNFPLVYAMKMSSPQGVLKSPKSPLCKVQLLWPSQKS